MFKTVLIVLGVFIGMGATWLADPVPLGTEVRDSEGAVIGRVNGVVRDEHGKFLAVTVAAGGHARFPALGASDTSADASPPETAQAADEDDTLRRRSISLESLFQAIPIWE